jgi:aminoglycoside 3-N-acetyltransferase I
VTRTIRQLTGDDVASLRAMLAMFGEAFDEVASYTGAPPDAAYLRALLEGDTFIAVAAFEQGEVVGGLAAYELKKFEQRRSEIYLYDLAVAAAHRRKRIATQLIEALKQVASERGAHVLFVQADRGDDPAITLYSRLGTREDVLHFDIAVPGAKRAT